MGVFQVTVTGTLFAQNIQNVMVFKKDGSVWATDSALLGAKMRDAFYAQIKFLCVGAMQWTTVTIIDPHNEQNPPLILPIVINGFQGSTTKIFLPLCGVYRLKTGVGGRRGRGRIYISGIDPNGIENGRWNAAQIINFNSVASSIKGQFVGDNPGSTFKLGVMRRGGAIGDFIPCTDIVVRDYPGTQTRRNFFRGK